MNIEALFHDRAVADPQAPAIISSRRDVDDRWSYHRLDSTGARIASVLREHGLRSGDAVLILVPMSPGLYATLAAVWRSGAVAMFVDPSAGREHVERCCRLIEPKAFVGTARANGLRLVSGPLRRIPGHYVVSGMFPGATDLIRRARTAPELADRANVESETPALITFTSGSTGQPKAAVRTHGFLLAQHAVLARHLHLEPGQIDLATLPVFAIANLASGVTSVIPDADLAGPASFTPDLWSGRSSASGSRGPRHRRRFSSGSPRARTERSRSQKKKKNVIQVQLVPTIAELESVAAARTGDSESPPPLGPFHLHSHR